MEELLGRQVLAAVSDPCCCWVRDPRGLLPQGMERHAPARALRALLGVLWDQPRSGNH